MIISKTPFRISFFGGGTDYPVWYNHKKGAVLSTTINKYCYLTCRELPPFFDYKYRIVWSKIENTKKISEILHPATRAILKFLKIKKGLAIHHDADLPARSGLGASSAFIVGLLSSLYAFQGLKPSKMRLIKEAIYIERDVLKENVGSQDQTSITCGGFNKIIFSGKDNISVKPINISSIRTKELENHLMLFFTGVTRNASDVAKYQIKNTPLKTKELSEIYQMVDYGEDILSGNKSILEFGKLLHNAWRIKRTLTNKITTSDIDEIYKTALKTGAIGGKLLGAGGGGFMLIFIQPKYQLKLKEKLKKLLCIPFKFEKSGSEIILNNINNRKQG